MKKVIKEIFNHFWISRTSYMDILIKSNAQVKKDMGKLYSSDIGRVKKQMEGFNKELLMNPLFIFGVPLPTIYLRVKSWLETYETIKGEDINDSNKLKELKFFNSAIYYKKKQIKYTLFLITGSKSFLKLEIVK